ncbi:MAG: GNAT family N-acetyltransferase [Chloroflexota bacterium]|nr:GNAT family N-acetyltransferase [Chloroflexota bacterium]
MTEISVTPKASAAIAPQGLRPVNMRTDLRPLADLIELVFADSMDSNGRSAIREMRYLSHMGYGLNIISRLNDLALGISLGFVYIMDGQLVGNVSVYPAGYPKDMSETWILANVAVHPAFQRRGIAGELVEACLEMIRQRNGKRVILQVNYDNRAALRLYERHGFLYERAWRHWQRSGFVGSPFCDGHDFHITRPGHSEWKAEYALAQAARPDAAGGLGWLKPTHESSFHVPLWKRLLNLFSLNSTEKLIIRDESTLAILASCWLESLISFSDIRLRFFASPGLDYLPHAEALFCNVLARYPRSTISIEHPRDDDIINDLLSRYQFKIKRELWHMRLDL